MGVAFLTSWKSLINLVSFFFHVCVYCHLYVNVLKYLNFVCGLISFFVPSFLVKLWLRNLYYSKFTLYFSLVIFVTVHCTFISFKRTKMHWIYKFVLYPIFAFHNYNGCLLNLIEHKFNFLTFMIFFQNLMLFLIMS